MDDFANFYQKLLEVSYAPSDKRVMRFLEAIKEGAGASVVSLWNVNARAEKYSLVERVGFDHLAIPMKEEHYILEMKSYNIIYAQLSKMDDYLKKKLKEEEEETIDLIKLLFECDDRFFITLSKEDRNYEYYEPQDFIKSINSKTIAMIPVFKKIKRHTKKSKINEIYDILDYIIIIHFTENSSIGDVENILSFKNNQTEKLDKNLILARHKIESLLCYYLRLIMESRKSKIKHEMRNEAFELSHYSDISISDYIGKLMDVVREKYFPCENYSVFMYNEFSNSYNLIDTLIKKEDVEIHAYEKNYITECATKGKSAIYPNKAKNFNDDRFIQYNINEENFPALKNKKAKSIIAIPVIILHDKNSKGADKNNESIERYNLGVVTITNPYNKKALRDLSKNFTDYFHDYNIDILEYLADIISLFLDKHIKRESMMIYTKQIRHEIYKPLAALKDDVDYMDYKTKNISIIDINAIINIAKNIKDMTQRLIKSARIIDIASSVKKYEYQNSRFEIKEPIEEAVKNIKSLLDENRLSKEKIIIEPQERKVYLNADKDVFIMMFTNIITNSIDYRSKKAGDIFSVKFLMDLDPKIDVLFYDKQYITIRVIDKSIGIDKNERHMVFYRGFRGRKAKQIRTGLGLGLSLVRKVLNDYGGHIYFENLGGNGNNTILKILLPENCISFQEKEDK